MNDNQFVSVSIFLKNHHNHTKTNYYFRTSTVSSCHMPHQIIDSGQTEVFP